MCVCVCVLNVAIEFFRCRILYELRFNIAEIYENVQLETLNKLSIMLDFMYICELNQRQL